MDTTPRKILIVTGEESGDMRGAALVRAIRQKAPHVRFIGIGGDHLRQSGVQTFTDINELAVIGFTEVLRHFPRIKKVFDLAVQKIRDERPDAVLLVDYPGFNLRLAVEAKKLGVKVIYYVSPQIWAWKESRVKTIKKVVDRMMVLFPFEKDFYTKHAYTADFVGHPLIDETRASKGASEFLKGIGLDDKRPTLALLPGSRHKEVTSLLPVMLETASALQKVHPKLQILLLQAKNLDEKVFTRHLANAPREMKISKDYYNALNAADFCIVASGTATLETGIIGKPMVVVYKTSWLTCIILKALVKIKYVSLVNIVAGRKIVEELLQEKACAEKIVPLIDEFLRSPQKADAIRRDLAELKSRLGSPGASQRAAEVVLSELAKIS